MNGATLFGGGEGVGVGMRQAGIEHLWGIEYDADICGVAKMNGFNSLHLDVTQADPLEIAKKHGFPDDLHLSPPCTEFSDSNTAGEESENDILLANSSCRFIEILNPKIVTVENVWGYRDSESFRCILSCLYECGYTVNWWHLNAANFGVPQTRKRMIVVALRSGRRPQRPTATHTKTPKPMFDTRLTWVGWYEAIEDLIPMLPESQFAPWQLKKLIDDDFLESTLFSSGDYNGRIPRRKVNEPSNTITANSNQLTLRAILIPGGNSSSFSVSFENEPARTIGDVNRVGNIPRAVLRDIRVVQMTPRALARFQSFPDWYKLPEKKTLACRVIGNAVPPLLYQRVIEGVIQ
jgi:DNA (cytosine-5)-methyltransferase 1